MFGFDGGKWLRWRGCVRLRWWCGGCGGDGVYSCDVATVCAAAV